MIAKHLPGRSDNDVKNMWHSTLRAKSCRRGSFLVGEVVRPVFTTHCFCRRLNVPYSHYHG